MIELNEFEFPAKDCFRLIIRHQMLRSFLFIGVAFAFYAGFTMSFSWFFVTAIIAFLVLTIIIFVQTYYLVFTKENQATFQKRKIIFDHEMMNVATENGGESKSPINNIVRADRCGTYYRLYLNRMMYLPIPLSAFQSEEDRKRFETEILGDKLQTRFPFKFLFLYLFVCLFAAGVGYGLHVLLFDHEPMNDEEFGEYFWEE